MKNHRHQPEIPRQNDSHEPQPCLQNTPVLSRREVIEAHLLDTAAKQFASIGYRQTTLEVIAQQAGIAKASIYRYVANKQELLCKIFVRVGATFAQALEPIQTAPLPSLQHKLAALAEYCRKIGRAYEEIEKTYLTPFYLRRDAAEVEALRQQIPRVQTLTIEQMRAVILAGDVAAVYRCRPILIVGSPTSSSLYAAPGSSIVKGCGYLPRK